MVIRRKLQRCLSLQSIFDISLRPFLDQNLTNLGLISFGSMVQRRPPLIIQAVDFGTIVNELCNHQDLIILHEDGMVKWIPSSMVFHVDDIDVVLRQ